MKSVEKITSSAEAQVFSTQVKELAVNLVKLIIDPNPLARIAFLEDLVERYVTIPDKIFFKKFGWFLNDLNNLRLSESDKLEMIDHLSKSTKEEFSFRVIDAIDKADSEKKIHFITDCLIYSLKHEEQNWLENFYRVIFIVLNTAVYSLKFLVLQLSEHEEGKKRQYRYDGNVQGLFSSGLMAIDVMGSPASASPGNQLYVFTPMADIVFDYIKRTV